MKEIDQQIALCEWAGFEDIIVYPNGTIRGILPGVNEEESLILPDTNSLDVLHSFEMKLSYDQQHHYGEALLDATRNVGPKGGRFILNGFGCFALANAGPELRRKCLLKTLNLWREDSNEVGK